MQDAFLKCFAECGIVTHACKHANIVRQNIWVWNKDPEFAARFEEARQEALEKLELEMWRRAHDGWDEPVWYKGEQCGVVRRYDSALLMFALRGLAPEKYRERYEHRITRGDGEIDVEIERELARLAAGGQGTPAGEIEGEIVDLERLEASEPAPREAE